MEHLNMQTPDGAQLNLDALYKLCPSCFTEGKDKDGNLTHKVNWNKLRELLGDYAEENAPESYDFTWVGKRAAQREAAAPINKTLRPCPEESVDWENTQNLYIEGDNLEVLKLLQNSYMGKVKMIYIDPPYNTGNDFVYHDDCSLSEDEYKESIKDENGKRLIKNTYSNGSFHSDWCSMMYARLMVARTLLREDGVICISIDDNEARNMRNLCDEVFGESNFVAQCIRRTINSGKHDASTIAPFHEYLLVYSKMLSCIVLNKKPKDEAERDRLYKEIDEYESVRGRFYITQLNKNSLQYSDALNYPIVGPDGKDIWPGNGFEDKVWIWRWAKSKVQWGIENGFIVFKKAGNKYKVYTKSYEFVDKDGNLINRNNPYSTLEFIAKNYANFNATPELERLFDGKKIFDFPKSRIYMKEIIKMANVGNNDILLDFFSGSGTSADALIELNLEDKVNRNFILVQLPELTNESSSAYKEGYKNICEIGKERIRRAGAKIKAENPNVDTGFRVFKCDSSNMKDVYFHPDKYSQDLLAGLEDNIKEDRTDLDLLFDCMLRWGVELSLPLSQKTVGGCTIHNVNDGDLVACFDGKITEAVIDEIAAMNPLRVVFRDSSFEEASEKMNLFELFKQKCQWSEQEVKNNVRVI